MTNEKPSSNPTEDPNADAKDSNSEPIDPRSESADSGSAPEADDTEFDELRRSMEIREEAEVGEQEARELNQSAEQSDVSGAAPPDHFEIRSIVLDSGDDAFVEIPAESPGLVQERYNALKRGLGSQRRILLAGLALLALACVFVGGVIAFNVFQRLRPSPTEVTGAGAPYPVAMTLPGGLIFDLERGAVDDGEWNPRGPEWLEGTEVCRWVAIPWSPQLEAVALTLRPGDRLELDMSNNDTLEYRVISISQIDREEMPTLDSNAPCLNLVLSDSESELRWVIRSTR